MLPIGLLLFYPNLIYILIQDIYNPNVVVILVL